MTARTSAGLLVFRHSAHGVELLLGHMGGPLWARRDSGAWSIPKGEHLPDEAARDAARREFAEELGLPPPAGAWLELGTARQSGGKVVSIWAVEGDVDPDQIVPGTFEMQWPPRSGRLQQFAEIDRVGWFTPAEARDKLVAGQRVFVERLAQALA